MNDCQRSGRSHSYSYTYIPQDVYANLAGLSLLLILSQAYTLLGLGYSILVLRTSCKKYPKYLILNSNASSI